MTKDSTLDIRLRALSPADLGQRLLKAREHAKVLQQAAAETLGISRATVVNIEKGQRRINGPELLRLASLYRIDPRQLVQFSGDDTDLSVQFRTLQEQDLGLGAVHEEGSLEASIQALQAMALLSLELEQLVGRVHTFSTQRQYQLDPKGDAAHQAIQISRQERHRLRLDDEPVLHLRNILEQDLNIRVYVFPMSSKVSGLYGYAPGLGGCIGLNAHHPPTRQLHTLAHEWAHILVNPGNTSINVVGQHSKKSFEERFAIRYSAETILPEAGLKDKIEACFDRNQGLAPSVADLFRIAHHFGSSFEALIRRLIELHLLSKGDGERLIKKQLVRQTTKQLDLAPAEQTSLDLIKRQYPESHLRYTVEAYLREVIDTHDVTMRFLKGITLNDFNALIRSYTNDEYVEEDGRVVTYTLAQLEERVSLRSR